MKKHAFLGIAVLVAVAGCGGGPTDRGDGSESSSSSESASVTRACCTTGKLTTCAGPTVIVQWLDRYWTDRPDEDDAGPCLVGQSCTAYSVTGGGLEPLGNGSCE